MVSMSLSPPQPSVSLVHRYFFVFAATWSFTGLLLCATAKDGIQSVPLPFGCVAEFARDVIDGFLWIAFVVVLLLDVLLLAIDLCLHTRTCLANPAWQVKLEWALCFAQWTVPWSVVLQLLLSQLAAVVWFALGVCHSLQGELDLAERIARMEGGGFCSRKSTAVVGEAFCDAADDNVEIAGCRLFVGLLLSVLGQFGVTLLCVPGMAVRLRVQPFLVGASRQAETPRPFRSIGVLEMEEIYCELEHQAKAVQAKQAGQIEHLSAMHELQMTKLRAESAVVRSQLKEIKLDMEHITGLVDEDRMQKTPVPPTQQEQPEQQPQHQLQQQLTHQQQQWQQAQQQPNGAQLAPEFGDTVPLRSIAHGFDGKGGCWPEGHNLSDESSRIAVRTARAVDTDGASSGAVTEEALIAATGRRPIAMPSSSSDATPGEIHTKLMDLRPMDDLEDRRSSSSPRVPSSGGSGSSGGQVRRSMRRLPSRIREEEDSSSRDGGRGGGSSSRRGSTRRPSTDRERTRTYSEDREHRDIRDRHDRKRDSFNRYGEPRQARASSRRRS